MRYLGIRATSGIEGAFGGGLDGFQTLGDAWNQTQIQKFFRDLEPVPESVNAGPLVGNRMWVTLFQSVTGNLSGTLNFPIGFGTRTTW
jgi:hypothetical protein